ncbi:MAG: hypothetical protein QOK05_2857 [Chloroflexota bacterium]|jgi:uncharacterized protein HemY|nr:hypothetical protein [Chloroflexota bacterium]
MPPVSPRARGLLTRVVPLLVALCIATAAAAALGAPDLPSAVDFMTSGRPSRLGAMAAIELVVWVLLIGLVLLQLVEFGRGSAQAAVSARRRRTRARAALLAGVLVFAGGAIRHQADGGVLCCGDSARADALLR